MAYVSIMHTAGVCVCVMYHSLSHMIRGQVDLLTATFPVFDEYRKKFLVGEMVWNFADFQTQQCT